MKRFKSWLALLLAIALVFTNAIYSMSTSLRANVVEQNLTTEGAAEQEGQAITSENLGEVQLDVVDENSQTITQAPAETQPVTEPAATETPVQEAVPEAVPEAVMHDVIINQPEVEGGSIQAWTTAEKAPVAFDENKQNVQKITEATPFYMEITADETHVVESVKRNENVIDPKAVNEKVYTYEFGAITEASQITILYKEITPTPEEPKAEEPKAEEPKAEEQAPEINIIGRSASVSLQNNEFKEIEIVQKVKNQETSAQSSFQGGEITLETAPDMEGCAFKEAVIKKSDNQEYLISYAFTYEGESYYAEADQPAVSKKETEDTIIFYYEDLSKVNKVIYQTGGETTVEGNSVEGPSTVGKPGELKFKVNTAVGYEAEVKVGEEVLIGKVGNYGLSTTYNYAVSESSGNTVVSIDFKKQTEFGIDLSWQNDQHDPVKGYLHGGTIVSNPGSTFAAGGEVVWTLSGAHADDNKNIEFRMNSFSINGEKLNVPLKVSASTESGSPDATAVTTLKEGKNKGIEVTITMTDKEAHGSRYAYTYTITIKNAKTDLVLTGANLRQYNHKEIMPYALVGVTATYLSLQSFGYKQFEQSIPVALDSILGSGKDINYEAKNGYSIEDGKREISIVDDKGQTYLGTNKKGYAYIRVPEDFNSQLILTIKATKLTYRVEYDSNGGSLTSDNATYDVENNKTLVVSPTIPTKSENGKNLYFKGWKLENDASNKLYQPGEMIEDIGSSEFSLNKIAPKGQIKFKAVWGDAMPAQKQQARYYVATYLMGENGSYPTEPTNRVGALGVLGDNVFLLKYDITKTIDGVKYTYNEVSSNRSGQFKAVDDNVINLYYDQTYEVTYTVDGEQYGEVDKVNAGSLVTLREVPPSKPGYTFNGWSRTENFQMPTENVKITGNYVANGDTKYTVEHYQEGVDGKYEIVEADTENLKGKTEANVTATENTYNGFTYDKSVEGSKPSGTITGDGKLVLKMYYTRNSYKVTYTVDGKQDGEVDSYKYEEDTKELRKEPTKEGYTFSGWEGSLPEKMGTKDITISGTFTINRYNVTYKVDKEQYGVTDSVEYNSLVTLRPEPSKPGYTFSGWEPNANFEMLAEDVTITGSYTANANTEYKVEHYKQNIAGDGYDLADTENLTGTTDTEATAKAKKYTGFKYDETAEGTVAKGIITGDKTLTLKLYYTRESYTVTYKIDSAQDGEKETYRHGADVTLRDKPSKEGYTFNGWSRTENFQMPTENVEITGNYVANGDTKYTVEHYQEGVDGKYEIVEADTENLKGKTDTHVIATSRTYTGYAYNKMVSGSKPSGTITGDGKLVLKMYYTRNSYKVTYEVDGRQYGYPDNYKYGEATKELRPEPSKEGYTFNGWNGELPETMGTEDVTISGTFTINSYNVTYKVDDNIDGAVELHEYDSQVVLRGNPAKEGYAFSGWDRKADFKMPARDVTIEGSFDINSYEYQVNYHYDNELAADETISAETEFGAVITAETPEAKERNGNNYMLVEGTYQINIKTAAEENVINVYYVLDNNGPEGTPDQIPDAEEYGIGYDSNAEAAQGSMTDTNIYPVGYQVPLKANGFTLDGFTFNGWGSERTGGEMHQPEGTIVMPEGGIVVYAQWQGEGGVTPVPPTEPGVIPTPVTPTTPTAPTDTTPTIPAAVTPAAVTPATVIATITQPLTALADTIGEVLNANVEELVAVDEEGVPLANRASNDHKCCILHLLLMMLALVAEITYTKSVKRRQKRIHELREEIALAEKERENQSEKEGVA